MNSILKAARALQLEVNAAPDPQAELDAFYAASENNLRARLQRIFGVTDVKIVRHTNDDLNALERGTPVAEIDGFTFTLGGDASVNYQMPERGDFKISSLGDFAALLPSEPLVKPALPPEPLKAPAKTP